MKGYIDKSTDIGELVRKAELDFNTGEVTHSKHVTISLKDDIDKIYAYLESKHTTGDKDSQGRDKPFFNIVLSARNIWFRATDIDRGDIKIPATKGQGIVGAFLATVHLQDWMRRENFGTFLNAWGINSAGFNESVLKFVEQGGRLIPSVVPWSRIICDPIDFKNNPKIEILELTEAQLRKRKGYDQEIVGKLCDTLAARETMGGEKKDNKADYVKLYEIHGELPLSYLTGNDEDKYEYVQQMHVISFVASKEKGEYDDFCLFSGREAKDPYMLTALLPEVDGSIALRGSVKSQFDAQWMQNHSAKAIKDQLDLADKLIFQTSDGNFVGQNALSSIQNGDILIHKPNEPLTQLQNTSHDITSSQNFAAMWKSLGNELTGISEAMLGAAPKSGTAWRQTEATLQENHSLFKTMTQNRGLAIEEMMREHILPFLKKKMDTKKEVAATLAAHDIAKIDAAFIKSTAVRRSNEKIKEMILNGEEVTPADQARFTAGYAQEAQQMLSDQGTQRFFSPSDFDDKTWKDIFKDLEWDIEVNVTGESVDKDAAQTLNTLLTFFQNKQGQPLTPQEQFVVNKILNLSGTVSPLELSQLAVQPPPQAEESGGKLIESMSYKDTPPDIQRQMEAQAGFKPSSIVEPVEQPLEANKKENAGSKR